VKLHEETLKSKKAKLGIDHPSTLYSMNGLAIAYAYSGQHAEALKLHEETLRLRTAKLGPNHPNTLESLYNMAGTHAMMIHKSHDGAKQADLAMEWLRKTVTAGFKDAAQIAKDKDLDALRGRDDFKKLLAELS